MNLFTKKPKCESYFTRETRTLKIKALSLALPNSGFSGKLGEVELEPEFVKVSEKLQELDSRQYNLCRTIANITDKNTRDKKFAELAEIQMEMLRVYEENRADFEKGKLLENKKADAQLQNPSFPKNTPVPEILALLDRGSSLDKIFPLANKINLNADDRFKYNRIKETYEVGADGEKQLDLIRRMRTLLLNHQK